MWQPGLFPVVKTIDASSDQTIHSSIISNATVMNLHSYFTAKMDDVDVR